MQDMRMLIVGLAGLLVATTLCRVPLGYAQGQDTAAQPSTEATPAQPPKARAKTARRTAKRRTVEDRQRAHRRHRMRNGYWGYDYCPTCERAVNYDGCGYYNCYPPRERECYGTDCRLSLYVDEDANLLDSVLVRDYGGACDGCGAVR
jgi:hypothetical protein